MGVRWTEFLGPVRPKNVLDQPRGCNDLRNSTIRKNGTRLSANAPARNASEFQNRAAGAGRSPLERPPALARLQRDSTMKRLLPLLALALAATTPTPVLAQTTIVGRLIAVEETAWQVPGSDSLPTGPFSKVLVLDANNDGIYDAVALRGSAIIVSYSTEVAGAFAKAGSLAGVTDIAVLPSAVGKADKILAAHGGQLSVSSYKATSRTIGWTNVTVASWTGVHSIVTAPVAGQHLVVGRIGLRTVRAGRFSTGLQDLASFTTTADVLATVIADVTSNALPEIVVLTTAGLSYYTLSGQLLGSSSLATPTARGAIAGVRPSTGTKDAIAWLTPGGAYWQLRFLAGIGAQQASSTLSLGNGIANNFGLVGMTSGDATGDGLDDLLVTITDTMTGTNYASLIKQAPGWAWTPNAYLLRLEGAATTNLAPGFLQDWNHDGLADAVFVRDGVGGGSSIELERGIHQAIQDYEGSQAGGSSLSQGGGGGAIAAAAIAGLARGDGTQGGGGSVLGGGNVLVEEIELNNAEVVADPLRPGEYNLRLRVTIPYWMRTLGTEHLVLSMHSQHVESKTSYLDPEPTMPVAETTYVASIPSSGGTSYDVEIPFDDLANQTEHDHKYFILRVIDGNTPQNGVQVSGTRVFGYAFGFPQSDPPKKPRGDVFSYFLRPLVGLPPLSAPDEDEKIITGHVHKMVGGVKSRNVAPPFPMNDPPDPGKIDSDQMKVHKRT